MAEGFGNENQEKPGYALFAEDLVNFIMFRYSPRYAEEKKPVPFSTLFYNENIQERFIDCLRIHELLNDDYIKYIFSHVAINSNGYTSTINSLEEDLFDKEFTENSFLNYCVHISTIAALFYNEGLDTAPEIAKSHIVNVLKNRLPGDRWTIVDGLVDNLTLPNVQSSESSDSNV